MGGQPLERAFQDALTRTTKDGLLQRVNGLDRLIQQVPKWPSRIRDQSMQRVITAITAYEESLSEQPYHAAPAERINGPLVISIQKRDEATIGIEPVELCSNIAAIGSTGSGKTAFFDHVLNGLDVVAPDTQQCSYDPKQDWLARDLRRPGTIIVDEMFPLNILIPPDFLTPEEYWAILVRIICAAYYGGFHLQHIFTESIPKAFAQYPNGPSLQQNSDTIKELGSKTSTYQLRDAQLNALTRLDDLMNTFPAMRHAAPPRCHTMQTLLTRPCHFGSKQARHAYEFLFTLWVELRHAYHQHAGIRDRLHTFIVADEALQLFDANARHITGEPLLTHTISRTREAGIGWGITLSSWRNTSSIIRANVNLQAVLRVTDGTESDELRRTLRLTTQQHEYLDHHLQRGEVILRLGHRYPEPILATYPPPTSGDKDVTTEELAAARARADALLPPMPLPVTITTPRTEVPVAFQLNDVQHRLLHHILTGPLRPTTVVYEEAEVPYQVGDRARAFLLKTGLIYFTPVTIGGGTGKRANILSGTKAGYALLNLTPPRRSRGGGIAHSYYCQELQRHITDASPEVALNTNDGGTKCADLLFRYDPIKHDWLGAFLAASATTPSGDEPTLQDGSLIAIEVEVSDPAESSVNNATKDHNAGVDLILIAVLPADRDKVRNALQKHVPSEQSQCVGIVNILQLLDTIRSTSDK